MEDSFSVARNHSLKYANGKWVFWMDADDTLPFRTGQAILDAASNAPAHVHAFVVPVQFVDEGPSGGTRVDHVKLFRNHPGLEFEGRIHEQILGNLRRHGGDVARIGEVVLHSGYDTTEEGQARKRERDWKLLKLDLEERPDHPFVLFNLGMTAHYTGGHKEAIEWLNKSIGHAEPGESHTRKAYALLASSYRALGDNETAHTKLHEGLASVGPDPELHFLLGQTNTALGRLEAAVDHYDLAMASDASAHFSSLDPGILGHKSLHNSAAVLSELGRFAEARERYLKAIDAAPHFLASAFLLFEQSLGQGDLQTAGFALDKVKGHEGFSNNWCEMARKRAEAIGGTEAAALTFESAVREQPASIEARVALSKVYFDQGKVADAQELLGPLVAHGVAEAAFLSGVCSICLGDTRSARELTALAMRLNPGHIQTMDQLKKLNMGSGFPEDADVLQ